MKTRMSGCACLPPKRWVDSGRPTKPHRSCWRPRAMRRWTRGCASVPPQRWANSGGLTRPRPSCWRWRAMRRCTWRCASVPPKRWGSLPVLTPCPLLNRLPRRTSVGICATLRRGPLSEFASGQDKVDSLTRGAVNGFLERIERNLSPARHSNPFNPLPESVDSLLPQTCPPEVKHTQMRSVL